MRMMRGVPLRPSVNRWPAKDEERPMVFCRHTTSNFLTILGYPAQPLRSTRVNLGIILAAGFLIGAICWADEPSEAIGPRIQVDETEYDLGVTFGDREYSHVFVFRNVGDEDLEILSVKGDCTCVAQLLSKTTIPPGGEGRLQVDLMGTANDRASRTVVMTTNDPTLSMVVFKLIADTAGPVEVEPVLIDLGQVSPGADVTTEFSIRLGQDHDAIEVTNIETTSQEIAVRFLAESRSDRGIDRKYQVSMHISGDKATLRESILIHTDSLVSPILEVSIRGELIYPFIADPPRMLFGVVESESSTTQNMTVIRSSNSDAAVSEAVCDDDRVTVELIRGESHESYVVACTFSPEAELEGLTARLRLLDADGLCLLSVPVYGWVQ